MTADRGAPTGALLGRALSDILAQTMVKSHGAMAGATNTAKDSFVTSLLEKLESELAPTIAQVFGNFGTTEELPQELKDAFQRAANPEHQIDVLWQAFGIIGLVLGGYRMFTETYFREQLNNFNKKFDTQALSPEVSATAVVRNVGTYDYWQNEAEFSGVNRDRFDALVQLSGEPPGPMDLVAAWRRGDIDETRLHRGILQSRVRDEWFDVYHSLRHLPLSAGDAIEAVVQGHLTYEEGKAVADKNGMNAADYEIAYQTAGNPPGVQDIGDLLNRGLISEADAEQAVRETRYKPKYTKALLQLREQLPPREAVVLMIERGVIDQPTAVKKLSALGYNTENATFLAQEALNRKHAKEHDLAKSEITSLYESGFINHDQATGFLKTLGYDDNEAGWILGLVDTAKQRHALELAVNRVHSLYVTYRLDPTEASTSLDAIGMAGGVRDQLLHTWGLEREANAKDLTLAQLNAAAKKGLIDEPTYLTRVQRLGYSEDDANLLASIVATS